MEDRLIFLKPTKLPKCRGKNLGRWVYGNHVASELFGNTLIFTENTFYPVDAFTVGREIGRRDKHGTTIYEDDVLLATFEGEFFSDVEESTEYGLVYWDKGACGFMVHSSCGHIPFEASELDEFEVIGNVHDNPELIQLFRKALKEK